MARDQTQRPLTDAELDELREKMEGQHGDIRDALAEQGVDVDVWDNEE